MKFDSNKVSEKSAMIRYFQEDLKLLVRVEIEKLDWKLNSFDNIVEKAVDVKAKTDFRLCSYTYETNQHCNQSSCFAATKFYA